MLGEARQESATVLVRLLSQFWPQKARKEAEKFGFGFFCVLLRPSASLCVLLRFLWHHFRVLVLGDPPSTWRNLTTRSRSDIRLAIHYLF
jgi:hypothetical protein